MDDTAVEKTLMDAQYTFLLKFLYKVLKGTTSMRPSANGSAPKTPLMRFSDIGIRPVTSR
jgi:hypothetical protein